MLRLIIVDDEDMIRNAILKMVNFEALGYEVVGSARNGIEAFDMICDLYPDVVLTDIKMPGLDGLELIEKALQLDQSIEFIILSGFGEFEYAKKAIQFGVKNYILKPTDKNELCQSLTTIKEQKEAVNEEARLAEKRLLKNLHFPIQSCFMIESLDSMANFKSSYDKYAPILTFPDTGLAACICSFVEDSIVDHAIRDIIHIFEDLGIHLEFPPIVIQGSFVFLIAIDRLKVEEILKSRIEELQYPGQKVNFEIHFMHSGTTFELYETVLSKLSRYNRINLIDMNGSVTEVRNNLATPWKIKKIISELKDLRTEDAVDALIRTVVSPTMPLQTIKNTAISLILQLMGTKDPSGADLAVHFFKRLYNLSEYEDIVQHLEMTIQTHLKSAEDNNRKTKDMIPNLKAYVQTHLSSESLSLKWIAENHLYVSVGYLSKQFIKEEGIRFSEYLNKIRMEEAIQLLELYNNASIKVIAKQVGFGNNPHYFSQVFRKFTGLTPTEYIESKV